MTSRIAPALAITIAGTFGAGLVAQWENTPARPIPRVADGSPDLTARAPRTDSGVPDLSGVWLTDRRGTGYAANLAKDFAPGQFPIQAWAEALVNERKAWNRAGDDSATHCLPPGIPRLDAYPDPVKIVQQRDLIVVLYEAFGLVRQIYLDGRQVAPGANPTWRATRSVIGTETLWSSRRLASTASRGSTTLAILPAKR